MARSSLGTINPSTTSGVALAALLSSRDAAENSGHSGTGRPSYATAGMLYTDDSFTPDHVFLAGAASDGSDDIDLTLLFSDRPGTIRETAEVRLPSGWLWADGTAVLRATYPNLLDAIAPTFTGSTNGNTTISSVSEDLRQLGLIGAPVEGTDVPAGATITAVSASTITISAAATGSHAGVTLRAFPFGSGNGSTTFNTPNRKGRTGVGRGDMGGTDVALITTSIAGFEGKNLAAAGGSQGVVLVVANLPAHSHSASTSGSTSSSGNHTHGPGSYGTGAGGNHTHTYARFSNTQDAAGMTNKAPHPQSGGSFDFFQDLGASITGAGVHSHTIISGASDPGGDHTHTLTLSTSVGNTGTDTTHQNVQPSVVVNYVVKT